MTQVHPVELQDNGMALQFEHPTIAGVTAGGWMNRVENTVQVSLSAGVLRKLCPFSMLDVQSCPFAYPVLW